MYAVWRVLTACMPRSGRATESGVLNQVLHRIIRGQARSHSAKDICRKKKRAVTGRNLSPPFQGVQAGGGLLRRLELHVDVELDVVAYTEVGEAIHAEG